MISHSIGPPPETVPHGPVQSGDSRPQPPQDPLNPRSLEPGLGLEVRFHDDHAERRVFLGFQPHLPIGEGEPHHPESQEV